jgi:hypothetical protein
MDNIMTSFIAFWSGYPSLDRSAASRIQAAYAKAWSQREVDSDQSAAPLMSAMKAANVPGIYTQPERNDLVAIAFDAWDRGLTPEQFRVHFRRILREVRRQRR